MKITARAAAASFTVTDEAGNTVAEYSVENMSFVTDISGLLECVSQAAHLFKALDATHNVRSSEVAAPTRVALTAPVKAFGSELSEHQTMRYEQLVEAACKLATLAASHGERSVEVAAKHVLNTDANDVGSLLEAARELNAALRYLDHDADTQVAIKAYRRARDLFQF